MSTLKEEFYREFRDKGVVGLSTHKPIREDQETLIEKVAEVLANTPPLMRLLDKTRDKLRFYHGHGLRTGVIFMDLLTQESEVLDSFTYDTLCAAGCYHDVGKLKVPGEILFNPGELSLEEKSIIDLHETYGEEMLSGVNGKIYFAHKLVGTHHRYPRLFANGDFVFSSDPLTRATMLLSLADHFEALSSMRDYRGPFPVDEVQTELNRVLPHLVPETDYLIARYENGNEKH